LRWNQTLWHHVREHSMNGGQAQVFLPVWGVESSSKEPDIIRIPDSTSI
jgi:hypothetical protein